MSCKTKPKQRSQNPIKNDNHGLYIFLEEVAPKSRGKKERRASPAALLFLHRSHPSGLEVQIINPLG